MEEKPKYNVQRHRTATVRASVRTAAALYIAYLGWSIIRDRNDGGSMPVWLSVAFGVLFLLIAAAIGLYAYKQRKIDLRDAEVRPEDLLDQEAEENDADDRENGGE